MITFAVVAGYLLCSFLAWGLTLGNFSKQFPYMRHTGIALGMAFIGPAGLLTALIAPHLIDQSGLSFRLKPIPYEERFQIFNKRFSALGRDFFDIQNR